MSSNKINGGGYAYPQHRWMNGPETLKRMQENGGMSLRDKFADSALQGMIANPDFGQPKDSDRGLGGFAEKVASLCYELADAMLVEREKEMKV